MILPSWVWLCLVKCWLQYLSEQRTGRILPISWSTINYEKPLSVGYPNINQQESTLTNIDQHDRLPPGKRLHVERSTIFKEKIHYQ